MSARVLTESQKQRARDRAKAWHWANRDRALAVSRKRSAAHPEEYRARTMQWRLDNPERAKENDRKKRANRAPEYLAKRAIDEQNRRARMRANGGRLSRGIAAELLMAQGGKCVYCRADLAAGYHLDHILPIALGGRNDDQNVQLLCPPCNRRKWAKHPDEFAKAARP
jgi:5-methylcytosine-specific restriction endonuclease McrA